MLINCNFLTIPAFTCYFIEQRYDDSVIEKLKHRTIRLTTTRDEPLAMESAVELLRDVRGVQQVQRGGGNRLKVTYNVREITMQIIEALLTEFGYRLHSGVFCSVMRVFCYYIEDIECSNCSHDQAECTRDAFITRYLRRQHGCRDHRPEYLRRYL